MAAEAWETRDELKSAAERFRDSMPGWKPPAAYGVGRMVDGRIDFPVVNADAHGLPALALASVCGHRSGNVTLRLGREQFRQAIAALSPAEACTDYEHPNLWSWRDLDREPGEIVAVFLASDDPALDTDAPQRRLRELVQVRPLAADLPGVSAPGVLDALDGATDRLVAALRAHLGVLDGPSLLPQWSRVTVLAHLRYVAEAMARMSDAAVEGRREDMYPGGRDHDRPRTLVPRSGESVPELVDSVAATARELGSRWHRLSASDWDRRFVDRDHGEIALSRLLVLRLTEVEVHSADLGLPGLGRWTDVFVDTVLPLRIAWLGHARRRPDADLTLDGSWTLGDGVTSWLVRADGAAVTTGEVSPQRSAQCRLTGTRRDLLAHLLGRDSGVATAGLPELAAGFKAAFPGP